MYIEHAAPVPKPINMLDTIVNYLFLLKDIIKPHSFIQSNFGFSSVELEGNLPFSICFYPQGNLVMIIFIFLEACVC